MALMTAAVKLGSKRCFASASWYFGAVCVFGSMVKTVCKWEREEYYGIKKV
jgi:hypothetical protein